MTNSKLQSILSHFPTEVCKYSPNGYWILSSVFVERLSTLWLQNDSNRTQVAQKRNCWNFSTPSESFRSVFEAKRCNVLFKHCNAKLVILLLSWLCGNLEQNLSENVQEMRQKRPKFESFWHFRVILRFFAFTNWNYLVPKTHQNNMFAHALGVIRF